MSRALWAFYDLDVSPITFDVFKFLILAEARRQELNLDNIHFFVVKPSLSQLQTILAKYQRLAEEELDESFLLNRVHNILVAASKLFPNIASTQVIEKTQFSEESMVGKALFPVRYHPGKPVRHYALEHIHALLADGNVPSSIVVPPDYLDSVRKQIKCLDKVLTITIRQTGYESWRNSELSAWIQFAKARQEEGYRIIWLPDSEASAAADLHGIGECFIPENPQEAILYQAALFQLAEINFFINGGMAALARFNHKAVSVSFKLMDERSGATQAYFWLSKGIRPGNQFRFLSPLHTQIWADDTYENISRCWQTLATRQSDTERKQQLIHQWYIDIRGIPNFNRITVGNKPDARLPTYIWGSSACAIAEANKLHQQGYQIKGLVDSYAYSGSWRDHNGKHQAIMHPCELNPQEPKNLILMPVNNTGEMSDPEPLLRFIKQCFPQTAKLVILQQISQT